MTPQREQLEADVLIVGAGPAGLACALHLANLIKKHNEAGVKTAGAQLSPENIYVLEKAREMRQYIALHECEYRMRLFERFRDREFRAFADQGRGKPCDEIGGQERRIAGRRNNIRRRSGRQSRVQSCEWPGKAADGVHDDSMSERTVALDVLIGVDEDVTDLRCEALEHVCDERAPVERHESLVDATHPPALTSREHDAGDIYERDHGHAKKRTPPVNTR